MSNFYHKIIRAFEKPKFFEGIIGKKMWNHCAPEIDAWYDARNFGLQPLQFDSVGGFDTGWTRFCLIVRRKFYKKQSSLDLHQRALAIRALLQKADDELNQAFWHYSKYKTDERHLRGLIYNCEGKIDAFIEYCKTTSEMDENAWGSCALALYLTENRMNRETAIKICKELGALKQEDLMEIQHNDIYGDVTTNYAGLSLTISEQNKLHQIWLAMHAASAVAKAKAELADFKAKVTPSKLGETDEMGEGTYTGAKKDGKRHGLGFMLYNKNDTYFDTYYGDWRDDKMNGRGTFRKNVRGPMSYDWIFEGDFTDNCPTSGNLQKPTDYRESYVYVKGDVTIFEWNPFPSDTALTPGLTSGMHGMLGMLAQLQQMAL